MAKVIIIFISLMVLNAQAELFEMGTAPEVRELNLNALTKNLKNLKIENNPAYEDSFNEAVKAIENKIETEKLYCSGEAQNSQGEFLPAAQKQFCMRQLKKEYVEATSAIFEVKKSYLEHIHKDQIKKLSEIQKKMKADIEKNF